MKKLNISVTHYFTVDVDVEVDDSFSEEDIDFELLFDKEKELVSDTELQEMLSTDSNATITKIEDENGNIIFSEGGFY